MPRITSMVNIDTYDNDDDHVRCDYGYIGGVRRSEFISEVRGLGSWQVVNRVFWKQRLLHAVNQGGKHVHFALEFGGDQRQSVQWSD